MHKYKGADEKHRILVQCGQALGNTRPPATIKLELTIDGRGPMEMKMFKASDTSDNPRWWGWFVCFREQLQVLLRNSSDGQLTALVTTIDGIPRMSPIQLTCNGSKRLTAVLQTIKTRAPHKKPKKDVIGKKKVK
jgi:hypothetical protein